MLKRLIKFCMRHVIIIAIRLIECIWLILLNLISMPLKFNLWLCQALLTVIVKGLCCHCGCRSRQT